MSDPNQDHRFAAIETPLGKDRLLLRFFNGREEMGRLFDYHLTLLDTQQDLDPNDLVGLNVSVRVQAETDELNHTRYFNGFIASMSFLGYESGAGVYHARMMPWLWMLTRTSDCRSFQDKTTQQILQEVFTDYGFKDFRFDLTGNYQPKVFCVQYNETAFNFVSRIMEHEGIYYWWEHENGKHTMVITDDMATHSEHPLRKEIEWQGRTGSMKNGHISALRTQKTLSPGGFSVNDYDFKAPKEDLRSNTDQKKSHAAASFKHFEYPGNYREGGYGESLSKIRLQEAQANHDTIDAQVTARAMAAGYKFLLKRAERADQEQRYLILSSSVSVTVNGYQTGGGANDDKFEGHITALPESAVFRPARVTPKPVMMGPQPAMVVGPPGEEIHCDEHGRVKVHFYWDRRSEANAESSKWVRVSQPSAGGQYGFMSIPRVGQEVLVEFMNGDPDQPIITGRVYNGENQHPYDPRSSKARSSWKTNTYPGGGGFNEFRLGDAKGEEQIFLHGQKDMDTRILNKNREFVGVSKHVITGEDSRELVEQDKHSTIVRDSIQWVKRDQLTQIGEDDLKRVGRSFQVTAIGDVRIASAGPTGIYASKDIGIHTQTTVVIDGSCVILQCGNNFVKVSADGVTIQGLKVNINSEQPVPPPLQPIPAKPVPPPVLPEIAADAPAGKVETSKGMGYQTTADAYPAQTVSDIASDEGKPFVENPASASPASTTPPVGASSDPAKFSEDDVKRYLDQHSFKRPGILPSLLSNPCPPPPPGEQYLCAAPSEHEKNEGGDDEQPHTPEEEREKMEREETESEGEIVD